MKSYVRAIIGLLFGLLSLACLALPAVLLVQYFHGVIPATTDMSGSAALVLVALLSGIAASFFTDNSIQHRR